MDGPETPSSSPEEAAYKEGRQVYSEYRNQGQHLLASEEDLDPLKEGIEGKLARLAEEALSLAMDLDPVNPNPPGEEPSRKYAEVLNELRGIGQAAKEDGNEIVFNAVDNFVHWD